ncbi:MAG: hypothetical protein MK098_13950 [Marinovum sp.]|nr:hypothetical protein [Marinovum sp.]
MTSTRSIYAHAFQAFGGAALVFCFLVLCQAALQILILALPFLAFDAWSKFCKRSSLHQRDGGVYVWVEWDGTERCSLLHPDAPGGEWDSDGDGGDGGD